MSLFPRIDTHGHRFSQPRSYRLAFKSHGIQFRKFMN